jgi:hypothetical protein
MATFDELFGGSGTGGQRWMKFDNEGEAYLLEQAGEPKLVDQKDANGDVTWLVKLAGADKYKPMAAGTFDPDGEDVENAFKPEKEIHIPVKAVAKKLKDGTADPNHEPFDTTWELTKDQRPKLKEAMLDANVPAVVGTKYVVKLLSRSKKPYTYSVKILAD